MNRSPSFLARAALAAILTAITAPSAPGWGGEGHRIITALALESAAAELPSWLTSADAASRLAYQCNEPDRFRSVKLAALDDVNGPDHFIDIELLEHWGMTLDSMPPLRTAYIAALGVARAEHPRGVQPDEAPDEFLSKDPGLPGTGLHAMAEQYAKVVSAMNTARTLEAIGGPEREADIAQARANVIFQMGMLSHFVGDLAQPLHTTIHHHGWVGANPQGFTRDRGIHAFIDSGVLRLHAITASDVRAATRTIVLANPADPWRDEIAYVSRSFAFVESLYALQLSGELERAAGKAFVIERLADASAMLGALYRAAWSVSAPTDEQVSNFVRFDEKRPAAPAGSAAGPSETGKP